MNCKKLMQNIMDVIAEEQIKLGPDPQFSSHIERLNP